MQAKRVRERMDEKKILFGVKITGTIYITDMKNPYRMYMEIYLIVCYSTFAGTKLNKKKTKYMRAKKKWISLFAISSFHFSKQ